MYHKFLDIMQNRSVKIIKETPILFSNIPYTFENHCGNQFDYKLFIIEWREKYYVTAHTIYDRDLEYTSVDDRLQHNISEMLYESFDTIEDAESFYDSILLKLPTPINLGVLLDNVKGVYGFDSRNSVNYDFHKKELKTDEFYDKEILRYNYSKMFIRMFRFGSKIVINKSLAIEFNSEEDAAKVCKIIRDNFKYIETTVIEFKHTELHSLLNDIIHFMIENVSDFTFKQSKDEIKRYKMARLEFSYDGNTFDIDYKLGSAGGMHHGYELSSSASIIGKCKYNSKYCYYRSELIAEMHKICDILGIKINKDYRLEYK